MRFIACLVAALVGVLSLDLRAEDTACDPSQAAVSSEEPGDFELLTPLTQAEQDEVRGENGFAPYSVILASAFAAANAFRVAYLGGCRTGMIQRNGDGTYSFVGCVEPG